MKAHQNCCWLRWCWHDSYIRVFAPRCCLLYDILDRKNSGLWVCFYRRNKSHSGLWSCCLEIDRHIWSLCCWKTECCRLFGSARVCTQNKLLLRKKYEYLYIKVYEQFVICILKLLWRCNIHDCTFQLVWVLKIFLYKIERKKINRIIIVNLKSLYLWKSYFIYIFFKYSATKNKTSIKTRNVYSLFISKTSLFFKHHVHQIRHTL